MCSASGKASVFRRCQGSMSKAPKSRTADSFQLLFLPLPVLLENMQKQSCQFLLCLAAADRSGAQAITMHMMKILAPDFMLTEERSNLSYVGRWDGPRAHCKASKLHRTWL